MIYPPPGGLNDLILTASLEHLLTNRSKSNLWVKKAIAAGSLSFPLSVFFCHRCLGLIFFAPPVASFFAAQVSFVSFLFSPPPSNFSLAAMAFFFAIIFSPKDQ